MQDAGELASGAVPDPQSRNTENGKRKTSPFSFTPLPDLYSEAASMLRSTAGQVVLARDDELGVSLHLAFLEWDGTDTGSTLEAFRHPPEACMGSIGLTLVANHPPRTFTVDGRPLVFEHAVFREGGGRGPALRMPAAGGRSSELAPGASLLPQPRTTDNRQPTTFPARTVHAFRAVWVAGLPPTTPTDTILGTPLADLRTLRLRCAAHRFRPAHARVVQGAVRGAPNADRAWQAFHDTLLADLRFEAPAPVP